MAGWSDLGGWDEGPEKDLVWFCSFITDQFRMYGAIPGHSMFMSCETQIIEAYKQHSHQAIEELILLAPLDIFAGIVRQLSN